MTANANLSKYFSTCRSYEFVAIGAFGVRIRFVFHGGVSLVCYAKNEQLEPYM